VVFNNHSWADGRNCDGNWHDAVPCPGGGNSGIYVSSACAWSRGNASSKAACLAKVGFGPVTLINNTAFGLTKNKPAACLARQKRLCKNSQGPCNLTHIWPCAQPNSISVSCKWGMNYGASYRSVTLN
jgi:hypothetical protein